MDLNSYVSWNVRGAGSLVSRQQVAQLNSRVRPTICCLQETKCTQWSEKMISQLGMGNDVGWIQSPSRSLSGGLITLWSKGTVLVTRTHVARHWILVQGHNMSNDCFFLLL